MTSSQYKDIIYSDLRTLMNDLRTAKPSERRKLLSRVVLFLEPVHIQGLLHQWGTWGLVLNSVLHLVKADIKSVLITKKKKQKPPTSDYVNKLITILLLADKLNGPRLQFHGTGVDFLRKSVVFGIEMIESEHELMEMDLKINIGKLMTVIVQKRVYCELLSHEEIENLLSISMRGISNSNNSSSGGGSSQASSSSSCEEELNMWGTLMCEILKHVSIDLHSIAKPLLETLSYWFQDSNSIQNKSYTSASILLEAWNILMERYKATMSKMIIDYGQNVIRYILRSWSSVIVNQRSAHASFISTYLQMLYCDTQISSIPTPSQVNDEIKALRDMLVDSNDLHYMIGRIKETQSDLTPSRLASCAFGISHFSLIADMVYFGDKLDVIHHRFSKASSASPRATKRRRTISTWTFLLENIESFCQTTRTRSSSQRTATGGRRIQCSPPSTPISSQSTSSGSSSVAILSWLILLFVLLTRHSDFPPANDLSSLIKLAENFCTVLENGGIELFGLWILELLSMLLTQWANASSSAADHMTQESLPPVWHCVWKILLRYDLEYANATMNCTEGSIGEAVLRLLSKLLFYQVVPRGVVEMDQDKLWHLPVFRSPLHDSNPSRMGVQLIFCYFLMNAELREGSDGIYSIPMDDDQHEFASTRKGRLLLYIYQHLNKTYVSSSNLSHQVILYASVFLAFFQKPRWTSSSFSKACRTQQYRSLASSLEKIFRKNIQSTEGEEDELHCGFGINFFLHEWGNHGHNRNYGSTQFSTILQQLRHCLQPFNAATAVKMRNHGSQLRDHQVIPGKILELFSVGQVSSSLPLSLSSSEDTTGLNFYIGNSSITPSILSSDGGEIMENEEDEWSDMEQSKNHKRFRADAQDALENQFIHLFENRIREFSKYFTMNSIIEADRREYCSTLYHLLQITSVIALLYPYSVLSSPTGFLHAAPQKGTFSKLLKKLFNIMSQQLPLVLNPSMNQSADLAVQFLNQLNTILLILQGPRLMQKRVPTGEVSNYDFPMECQTGLREVMKSVESYLRYPKDHIKGMVPTTPQKARRNSSSSSQERMMMMDNSSILDFEDEDAFDDDFDDEKKDYGNRRKHTQNDLDMSMERDEATPSQASSFENLNELVALWCIRLLTVLRPDTATVDIIDFAVENIDFAIDSLLAIANILNEIPGASSTNLRISLYIHCHQGRTTDLNVIEQFLSLFTIVGKNALSAASFQDIDRVLPSKSKGLLQKCLFQSSRCYKQSRTLRMARVACCETFFRIEPEEFKPGFSKIIFKSFVDKDALVRLCGARIGIPTLFQMYPDGHLNIFDEICQNLPSVSATASPSETQSENENQDYQEELEDKMIRGQLIPLFLSATCSPRTCSNVLFRCLRHLGHTASSSFLLTILVHELSTEVMGYSSSFHLLEDYFIHIVRAWIDAEPDESITTILQHQFPFHIFGGQYDIKQFLQNQFHEIAPIVFLSDMMQSSEEHQKKFYHLIVWIWSSTTDDTTIDWNDENQVQLVFIQRYLSSFGATICLLQITAKNDLALSDDGEEEEYDNPTLEVSRKLQQRIGDLLSTKVSLSALMQSHISSMVQEIFMMIAKDSLNLGVGPKAITMALRQLSEEMLGLSSVQELMERLNPIEFIFFLYIQIHQNGRALVSSRQRLMQMFRELIVQKQFPYLQCPYLVLHVLCQLFLAFREFWEDCIVSLKHLCEQIHDQWTMKNWKKNTPSELSHWINLLLSTILRFYQEIQSPSVPVTSSTGTSASHNNTFSKHHAIEADAERIVQYCKDWMITCTKPEDLYLIPIPEDVSDALNEFRSKYHAIEKGRDFDVEEEEKNAVEWLRHFVLNSKQSELWKMSRLFSSQVIEKLKCITFSSHTPPFYRQVVISLLQIAIIHSNSSTIQIAVANCFGKIGASDYDLSLGTSIVEYEQFCQRTLHFPPLSQFHSTLTSEAGGMENLIQQGIIKALKIIVEDLLFTSDCALLAASIQCLQQVLDTSYGKEAYVYLGDTCSLYLAPFVHIPSERSCYFENENRHADLSYVKLTDSWILERSNKIAADDQQKYHQHWIQQISHGLALECDSHEILHMFASLCRQSSVLATCLFPYFIYYLLHHEKNEEYEGSSPRGQHRQAQALLSQRFQQVLQSQQQHMIYCQQLCIHTLNFLRETQKVSFMQEAVSNYRKFQNHSSAAAAGASSSSNRRRSRSSGVLSSSTTAATSMTCNSPSNIRRRGPSGGIECDYPILYDIGIPNLNYFDVAQAALRCSMPLSAIQYLEFYAETLPTTAGLTMTTETPAKFKELLQQTLVSLQDPDYIFGVQLEDSSISSQLMIYQHEKKWEKCLPLYDILSFQQQQQQPSIHVSNYSWNSNTGSSTPQNGLFQSLNHLGYRSILNGMLSQMTSNSSGVVNPLTTMISDNFQYEQAWRRKDWNFSIADSSSSPASQSLGFSNALHQCLGDLSCWNTKALFKTSNQMKIQIFESFQLDWRGGLETTQRLSKGLQQFQALIEIEETSHLFELKLQRSSSTAPPVLNLSTAKTSTGIAMSMAPIYSQWQKRREQIHPENFDTAEYLMSLETICIEMIQDQSTLVRHFKSGAKLARKAERFTIALSMLEKLENMIDLRQIDAHDRYKWRFERSKVLWNFGEKDRAIASALSILHQINHEQQESHYVPKHQQSEQLVIQAQILRKIGQWKARQCSESSQDIIDKYLRKATACFEHHPGMAKKNDPNYHLSSTMHQMSKTHKALGHFSAEMYVQIESRVKSEEWRNGKKVAATRQLELEACLRMSLAKQKEHRGHIHTLKIEVAADEEERIRVEESVQQFLVGAISELGKAMEYSDQDDLTLVFRVISLWFKNSNVPQVNQMMSQVIQHVPSYKFLSLIYQIISRIGSSSSSSSNNHQNEHNAYTDFHATLDLLIQKVASDHPHHVLVQLISLRNGGQVEGRGSAQYLRNIGEQKITAAQRHLDLQHKFSVERHELLTSLELLCTAYCELALCSTKMYHQSTSKSMLKNIPLSDVKSSMTSTNVPFDQCLRDRTVRGGRRRVVPHVLTLDVAIRTDRDYADIVRTAGFASTFSITETGIHRPKIILALGSNGKKYRQLVKGHDDTRQDLVIEQTFDTVNKFLAKDPESSVHKQRQLHLRTYKVVPLSPIAGVLEWVEHTTSIGAYLTGKGPYLSAHERYHPHEWKHMECREYLKSAKNKLLAFNMICEQFRPVFHHFFLEHYPDPSTWFDRRRNYIRSLATSCIVGHILGIGDRHCQNILIDVDTAEIVQIDFGVVFDQGMALPTPETVPFRLTRDLIDGMGITGVEGIFKRCCEVTMNVLRMNGSSLTTILEVFVHDPLYRWTLSPVQALALQRDHVHVLSSSSSPTPDQPEDGSKAQKKSDAAKRALLRVKQKLQGYEDPNGNVISVEGQVKGLITAAIDPRNLCRLFPGWAPWL